MNTVGLIQVSLGFALEILEQVVSDLTQEQADWLPPGNANPIGALYWHIVAYCDQLAHEWGMAPFRDISYEEWLQVKRAKHDLGMGQTPLRHSAGWQERVVIASPPESPEDPYWDLRAARDDLRVNLSALQDYAQATAQALRSWVEEGGNLVVTLPGRRLLPVLDGDRLLGLEERHHTVIALER